MSTGIGKHKFAGGDDYARSAYSTPRAICPYCSCEDCEADYVDVGVGMIQCGPYYCPECHASEASYLDSRPLTEIEEKTGWYEPESPVSENANTVDGHLVDHKTAKVMYVAGKLDTKEPAQ